MGTDIWHITVYIVFILKCGVFTTFLAKIIWHLAWISIWVSIRACSLFNQCILFLALHKTHGVRRHLLSKCTNRNLKNFNCYLKYIYVHLTSIPPIIAKEVIRSRKLKNIKYNGQNEKEQNGKQWSENTLLSKAN